MWPSVLQITHRFPTAGGREACSPSSPTEASSLGSEAPWQGKAIAHEDLPRLRALALLDAGQLSVRSFFLAGVQKPAQADLLRPKEFLYTRLVSHDSRIGLQP